MRHLDDCQCSGCTREIRPQPAAELLSWCITWAGEPRKRQPYVGIWIWVPAEIAAEESAHGEFRQLGVLADYIHAKTGFTVARTAGWSGGADRGAGLACVSVSVASKEVRRLLAEGNGDHG